MKKHAPKLLLITSLLGLLLLSTANSVFSSSVQAGEFTIEQKSLSVSSDVIGLNMSKYTPTMIELPQNSYRDVVPQENVHYTLESNESKLDLLYTFADGKLRKIYVLETVGFPHFDESENTKSFLNNYNNYSGNSFYGDLALMLNQVDTRKNTTMTSGNVKLEVTNTDNSKTFKWTYTFNGIEAPEKCVALGYKDGFLNYFLDNWDLYKIGSTSINVSEEEAVDLVMGRSGDFSWRLKSNNSSVEVKNFTVANAMVWETVFSCSLYADEPRSEDLLMLYPMRHVWVSLDKFYPGNVYGFNVYVWADTGEICYVNERVSTMDPPANLVATSDDFAINALGDGVSVGEVQHNMGSITGITVAVFTIVAFASVPACFLLHRKKKLLKWGSFKLSGVLLCFLAVSMVLVFPVLSVSAEPTRRALIWGSESNAAKDSDIPGGWSYWRKTEDEVYRQGITSNQIRIYFDDDQYDVDNYQGDGSIATQIVANISDAEDNYSRVAVIDFDHGVGLELSGEFHYMFEDQNGTLVSEEYENVTTDSENAVYDKDVYPNTGEGKNFFTFINTCLSANLTWQGTGSVGPLGMPYAWTHRYVVDKDEPGFTTSLNMSDDGYADPDDGDFVYLGFPYGSAALDQTITGISPIYATWLENFFWYALTTDISVNQALDEASIDNFEDVFSNTDLAEGFDSVWPTWNSTHGWHWDPMENSTLVVYGNGNIHLFEYFVHDYVDASGSGVNAGVNNPDDIEGGSNDSNYAYLYATGYYGDQAVITGNINWNATGHIYLYGKTNPGYNSHVLVYVSYDYSTWYPVNENLWITQSSPGWIDVGTYANEFRYIAIVVYADYYASTLYVDSVLVIP